VNVVDDPKSFTPDYAFPPGAFLEERLEELRMTQVDLARRTGLSTKHVNQIVSGDVVLTPQTALLLEKVTGMPASLWNALEAQYRTWQSAQEEENSFAEAATWPQDFPVRQLVDRGYLPAGLSGPALVRALLKFFGVGSLSAWHQVYEPLVAAKYRHARAGSRSPEALATWLRIAELSAEDIKTTDFSMPELRKLLGEIPSLTLLKPEEWWPLLVDRCAAAGIALVHVPEFEGQTKTNGASWWTTPRRALVVLSGRRKTADGMWFTFAHEVGHLVEHSKKERYIDIDADRQDQDLDIQEKEADAFAARVLIPPRFGALLRRPRTATLGELRQAAASIGVHPGILVGRLQNDGLLSYRVGHKLRQSLDLSKGYWFYRGRR